MKMVVHGVGVLGPGIKNWESCLRLFKDQQSYDNAGTPDPMPSILPANERRRSSDVVRWSLQVAQEAVQHCQLDPKTMATVFASSGGEVGILHKICQSLDSSTPMVSPTLFHQSVHNAAAGYWSIASGSQRSSTSLACYDSSFVGGLLEAATLLSANQEDIVLLVTYDTPAPFPLYETRPLIAPFAVAFVVSQRSLPDSVSMLDITLLTEPTERSPTTMVHPALERLRSGNPAARSLPLLQSMCTNLTACIYLDFLDNLQLRIDHRPCPPYPD